MNLTSSFGKLFSSVKLTLGLALTITFMSASISTHAQDIENVKPVKNVIVLIPDGCSLATVSAARWYQWYMNPDIEKLAIDPYLCGTVRTTCSNAPIGDSAPTTSAYMTGYNSLAGWVSTYPVSKGKDDIYPMDPAKAYQPLTTVLEAAKMLKGKATGLVCTCYFTNATPADCSAHSHDRNSFTNIASQQVHNGVNVVIGGGVRYMTAEHEKYLTSKGVTVLKNDIDGMRNCTNNNMWALFRSGDMSHDLDRDPSKEPSLAEMTETAISKLSTDPDGFFLMVEGSEVDYCAHDNDLIGMVTEFLAFDKACKVALDFAKKNGETAVVILPDHGNSGLSLGRRDWGGYATMPMDRQFGAMAKFKATCGAIADKLNRAPFEQAQDIFKEWCGFRLKDSEIEALKNNKGYRNSPIEKDNRKPDPKYNGDFARMIAQFMTDRTGFAFTTNGHTGEDVFLAAYHPDFGSRPHGMLTNIELNHYLCNLFGMNHDTLDDLTSQIFVPHTKVFDGLKYEQTDTTLTVKYKKNKMVITPNTNIVTVNGKEEELKSVVIYVDKNKTYYIPQSLRARIESK